MSTATETRADMSTADINDLDDDQFAYIEPGGTKDDEGKTVPRDKRHFPVHDAAHVRNALARMDSSPFGDKARPKILAAAKKFGIDVDDSKTSASRTPLELLRRRRGSMIRQAERRRNSFATSQFDLRAKPDGTGGTMYELDCYGSVFDYPFEMWDMWGDPYTERVRPGAFTETLATPGLDVPLLLGHNDQGIPFARTTNGKMHMAEDSRGLHVNAERLNGSRSDVRNMVMAVGDGDLNEVSIGFVTMQQEWSPDWMQRDMLSLDLHRGDVSLVALAANPATKGATMTAMPGEASWKASWKPEGRARGEIADNDSRPDFNVDGVPPYNAAAHGASSIECPNDACPVYAGGDGQRALNAQDARYCDQCGGPLYNADGLIVADDNGVVEEVGGAMADADLLSAKAPDAETLSAWLELERRSA